MTATLLATDIKPVVEVTRVTDDNADAVAEFMCRVWGGHTTGERVRRSLVDAARSNPAVRGASVPSVVYLRDGEALGYLGTIPVRFWNGKVESPAHWLKGFMVLPEHQNGPIGFALLRELLRHVDVSGTMTVAVPARRLFQAVGFVDAGPLPNFIALLRPGRVAKAVNIAALGLGLPAWLERTAVLTQRAGIASMAGAIGGAGLRAWKGLRRPWSRLSIDSSRSLPSGGELDDLWLRARQNILAGATRDGSYLAWRYEARAGGLYEAVTVRERGGDQRVAALAIVRRPTTSSDPRLRGITLATLADIVFNPSDQRAGMAAIEGAERAAHRMGADALLCSTAHPAITSSLRRAGFIQLEGNVHLMLREQRGSANFSHSAEDWWLMRGDANSDDAF